MEEMKLRMSYQYILRSETYHKTFQNENYLCVAYCAYLNTYKKIVPSIRKMNCVCPINDIIRQMC